MAQLMVASSAVQKLDILSDDTDWKFDFNTEPAGANDLGMLPKNAILGDKMLTLSQAVPSSLRTLLHSLSRN